MWRAYEEVAVMGEDWRGQRGVEIARVQLAKGKIGYPQENARQW